MGGVSWRVCGLGLRRYRRLLCLRSLCQQHPARLHCLPAVRGYSLGLGEQPELSAPRRVPGLVLVHKVQEISVLRQGEFSSSTHG